jgi:hypothetical protein
MQDFQQDGHERVLDALDYPLLEMWRILLWKQHLDRLPNPKLDFDNTINGCKGTEDAGSGLKIKDRRHREGEDPRLAT